MFRIQHASFTLSPLRVPRLYVIIGLNDHLSGRSSEGGSSAVSQVHDHDYNQCYVSPCRSSLKITVNADVSRFVLTFSVYTSKLLYKKALGRTLTLKL